MVVEAAVDAGGTLLAEVTMLGAPEPSTRGCNGNGVLSVKDASVKWGTPARWVRLIRMGAHAVASATCTPAPKCRGRLEPGKPNCGGV